MFGKKQKRIDELTEQNIKVINENMYLIKKLQEQTEALISAMEHLSKYAEFEFEVSTYLNHDTFCKLHEKYLSGLKPIKPADLKDL